MVDPDLPFARDPTAGRYYDNVLQTLLGDSGVETTMIYAHVLRTAARLAYVGRSMGHEDFHGGSYEDPHKTLW